jgi:hypothetical protein
MMGKRGRTLGREIMIQFMHFKKDDWLCEEEWIAGE